MAITHILRMPLFFLICLQYIQELLVSIRVISIVRLNLVQVLYSVVELARRLFFHGIPVSVAEVAQK